jgi:hypothetical protein
MVTAWIQKVSSDLNEVDSGLRSGRSWCRRIIKAVLSGDQALWDSDAILSIPMAGCQAP